MAFYGSSEWMESFKNTLNSDDEFAKEAGKFSGTFLSVTEIKGLPRPIYVWFELDKGQMVEWEHISKPEDRKAEFVMTGDYYTWKDICLGKQDPLKAVMSGRLKTKGNKLKLLKQTKPSMAMIKVMQKLSTEFIDDKFKTQ